MSIVVSTLAGTAGAQQRELLVCVDYEGSWGMPRPASYDLASATEALLELLARHGARAVFFMVGALAIQHPRLVSLIAQQDHQIALHGWEHENLAQVGTDQLGHVRAGLRAAENTIESVSGKRPVGFRAPYLLAPLHYRQEVHAILEDHGYRWTSNRELRQVVTLVKPDGEAGRSWRWIEAHPQFRVRRVESALQKAFNLRPLRRDPAVGSWRAATRWLGAGCPPFFRGSVLEVPVYGPLDCHLVGLPDPATDTPRAMIDYASFAYREILTRSGPITMLTFHDWLISGGNRLSLLDGVLTAAAELSLPTTTVEECWPQLLRQAEVGRTVLAAAA